MTDQPKREFGPYVLDKLISAEGGQGMVYLATHKALGKRVVIKILRDHLAKHASFVERFAAEATQLSRMDHANIVRVRQSGPSGEQYYIEMEYIEGWDLSSWLREHGQLPAEIAILVLQRIAAGLEHAHEHSIIHRDVKPGNVMLTPAGGVKVLDFGLARDMDAVGRSTPGTLMGTYAYMSPQQVDGEEATIGFDIYSLGVVAYQLLSGRIPFEGTIATVCMKILHEEPAPLERACPEAPKELVKLVARMMAKKPERRPADMRVVEEHLRAIARQLGMKASDDLLRRYLADPDAVLEDLKRRQLRRRWRPYLPVAAAAVLVVLAAMVVALLRRPPAATPERPDSRSGSPRATQAMEPPAVTEVLAAPETLPVGTRLSPVDTGRGAVRARAGVTAVVQPAAAASRASPVGPALPATVTPLPPSGTLPATVEDLSTGLSRDSIVVDVRVTPAAEISLDGVSVATGTTRWTQRALRKKWTVRVDAGDYGTREQKKKPRDRDAVLSFAFDLSDGEGGVNVIGPRGGLDIYVDGVYQHAIAPSPVRPIKVGPHLIELRDRRTGEVVASRQIVVKQSASNPLLDLSAGR